MTEPSAALTDLLLGVVTLGVAWRIRRLPLDPSWRHAIGWAAASALAGSVHHALVPDRWRTASWVVISAMIVLTISATLAATVRDVLGPGRGRVFWLLRSASLVVYAALAAAGHSGISVVLACEGLTMLCVLALWGWALHHHHPHAPAIVLALAANGLAGVTRALPSAVGGIVGLDPTSLYHVAQIPGTLLLGWALVGRDPSVAPNHLALPNIARAAPTTAL